MIHTAIERVIARQDLTRDEAYVVLRSILNGEANDAQIAGLLVALAMKGETVEEIVGFARAMREEVTPVGRPRGNNVLDASGTGHDALLPAQPIVDTCGTGGDASGTFNISTATAFTVAGAGVRVAKHGNRSISSRCGSADVIEALGVNINLPASAMSACLEEVGMAFLFAPALHTAMRYVQPARRALRVRTIFNLLGPLTNPAGAQSQVVGVYAAPLAEKLAYALRELGTRHAFVVHSEDGLDEISTTAPTRIAEVRDGSVATYVLDARDYGFPRSTLAELAGGDVNANVSAVRSVLSAERGPKRDIVVLNAAAALVAAGRVTQLEDGIALATESLQSAAAANVLERLVAFTNSAALANVRA